MIPGVWYFDGSNVGSLAFACPFCDEKPPQDATPPPKPKKKEKKVNVLDRHNSNYISIPHGDGWKGVIQKSGRLRHTQLSGIAATVTLSITMHDLACTSQVHNDNTISYGSPLYKYTPQEYKEMVETQESEMRQERSTIKKADKFFGRGDLQGNDPVVVASLNLVIQQLRDTVDNPRTWRGLVNNTVINALIADLEGLRDKCVNDTLTSQDNFIFAQAEESGEFDYDDMTSEFQVLTASIPDNEFSMRATSLAMYLFFCEVGHHGGYNVPKSLLCHQNKSKLSKERVEQICRSAINHGANSMWRDLMYRFGDELRNSFGDRHEDSLTMDDKKVRHYDFMSYPISQLVSQLVSHITIATHTYFRQSCFPSCGTKESSAEDTSRNTVSSVPIPWMLMHLPRQWRSF